MVKLIALVCDQNKKYQNEEWIVLPKSYLPEDNQEQDEIEALYKQLVFALKYEGINLLLKDSKASFSIEGESPKSKRAARWGQAIGQAGSRDLNQDELKRLQQVVIENTRFTEMGFREKGGFIGEHDRISGEPIPAHISAKWQDLPKLLNGLIETNKRAQFRFVPQEKR